MSLQINMSDTNFINEHELSLKEREAKICEMELLITEREHKLKSTE